MKTLMPASGWVFRSQRRHPPRRRPFRCPSALCRHKETTHEQNFGPNDNFGFVRIRVRL
jgi:hypothetical protein